MARPRTFDEGDVIAAARDEFWNHGYAATSVDDLTAATGLGKGSLYGAFGDKHGLYLRVLDDYIASSLNDVRAGLRIRRSPLMNGLRATSAGRPRRSLRTRAGAGV